MKPERFKKGPPKSGKANSCRSGFNQHKNIKDCLVHGKGYGPPSHKCKVLMDHVRKLKSQHKAQVPSAKTYKKGGPTEPWNKGGAKMYIQTEVQILLQGNNQQSEEHSEDSANYHMEVAESPCTETVFTDLTSLMREIQNINDKLDALLMEDKSLVVQSRNKLQGKFQLLEAEQECFALSLFRCKKSKKTQKRPKVVVEIATKDEEQNQSILQCLLDSRSSGSSS